MDRHSLVNWKILNHSCSCRLSIIIESEQVERMMKLTQRDEEILAQLEAIKSEIKEAKQQTASTVAVNNRSSSFKTETKKWNLKWSLLLIVLLLVGSIIGIGSIKFLSGATPEVEKGSFIEHMKELSSLASSQAFVKAVIEKENNQLFGKEISTNLPGTKRKLLLVVPGTVTAGVDLQNIGESQLKMNEEAKMLEITLPHATIIQEPSLDFEEIQAFSVEGIFRSEVNWEEAYDLAAEASTLVKEEAIAQGLLEMAEKNAEKTLKEFFTQLGYEVSIRYEN